MEMDLLNADPIAEDNMHKLKKLVQSPNSFFLDVRCSNCHNISTLFSHSQTSFACPTCGNILCTTSGGKAKLTVGSSWRRKGD
jgi:small subunit ribosomal protein S27e